MTSTKNKFMSFILSFIMAFTVFGVLGTAQVNAAENDAAVTVTMWYGKAGVNSMPAYKDKDASVLAEKVVKTYSADEINAMDQTDFQPYYFTGKNNSVTVAAVKGVKVESLLENVVDTNSLIDLKTAQMNVESPFMPNGGQKKYLTKGVTYTGATEEGVKEDTDSVDVPFIIATQRYEVANALTGEATVASIFNSIKEKEEYLKSGYRSYMGSDGTGDLAGNKFISGVDSIVCFKEAAADDITVSFGDNKYDGKEKKIAAVKIGETTLTEGTDYSVSYTNNVNAGTATAVIKGITFAGEKTETFTIAQTKNPMAVKSVNKTFKAKKVKKKAQSYKAITVTNAQGTVTYTAKAANAKSKKALKFNKKNGKITVKKKTKKGTYKMKITVATKGNANYAPSTATKTVTVKVK